MGNVRYIKDVSGGVVKDVEIKRCGSYLQWWALYERLKVRNWRGLYGEDKEDTRYYSIKIVRPNLFTSWYDQK